MIKKGCKASLSLVSQKKVRKAMVQLKYSERFLQMSVKFSI